MKYLEIFRNILKIFRNILLKSVKKECFLMESNVKSEKKCVFFVIFCVFCDFNDLNKWCFLLFFSKKEKINLYLYKK